MKKEEEKTFDILKHRLVPEHTILGEAEKKVLMDKYNIIPQQLPKIDSTDPVVKSIGAKVGDVLKVIRSSHTAGTSEYFRIVIKEADE
ncbi:MAG: DNA-directed RNA polymerase subunit H [Candidatus Aenigmarchaeota archaeon]|nr:DNA-directed RNA polymerase subunit H [Candidatus Aenigmarchaeota archaeon]